MVDPNSYVGQTINGLEILSVLPHNAHNRLKLWLRCSCGQEFSAGYYNILRGQTKSCGAKIHKIGMGYKRQPDDKLIAAYYRNQADAKAIREAFEERGLPAPAEL